MRYLFLIFVIIPVLEMWLLITVGNYLGALPTIGLVLLTAFIGVNLLRAQGFETLWRGRRKFEEGQLPAQEIAEGIILAVSGALLLTPGFVTDLVGFSGLIPPIRRIIAQFVLSRMVVASVSATEHGSAFYASGSSENHRAKDKGDVIEGESWDESDRL
ncbi:MAG: FxsA family protein [Porticoccaceae bacterium]